MNFYISKGIGSLIVVIGDIKTANTTNAIIGFGSDIKGESYRIFTKFFTFFIFTVHFCVPKGIASLIRNGGGGGGDGKMAAAMAAMMIQML